MVELDALKEEIITCQKCPRLREWCLTRAGKKYEYRHEEYWGLPVPSFGDHQGSRPPRLTGAR